MSVVEGLKIQIHVCGTYVLSVWFTLLIGFGSVWIFSRYPVGRVLKLHVQTRLAKIYNTQNSKKLNNTL